MYFLDNIKNKFTEVIEFTDNNNKLVIYKYHHQRRCNQIKIGLNLVVKEGQKAIIIKDGIIEEIYDPGTHTMEINNHVLFDIVKSSFNCLDETKMADLYFVNMGSIIDNKWATKSPVLKKDLELGMVRVRSFGKFSFKIDDLQLFINEIFRSNNLTLSYDIIQYLTVMVAEAFAQIIIDEGIPILNILSNYDEIGNSVCDRVNSLANRIGIEFTSVIIESISLPEHVEKLIDEQFVSNFGQNNISPTIKDNDVERLRELKLLLNEGIITQAEFDLKKKQILKI